MSGNWICVNDTTKKIVAEGWVASGGTVICGDGDSCVWLLAGSLPPMGWYWVNGVAQETDPNPPPDDNQ